MASHSSLFYVLLSNEHQKKQSLDFSLDRVALVAIEWIPNERFFCAYQDSIVVVLVVHAAAETSLKPPKF